MADLLLITDGPVRHTSNEKQDLRLAVDVSGYDELDLQLTVQEDTGGTSISVRMLTAMQMESDEGWVTVDTFTSTSAGNSTKKNFSGFLKYVRYELVSGATTTFEVSGVGRRWA